MLGKILKYDLLSEYKKFGVLYAGMLVISLFAAIYYKLLQSMADTNNLVWGSDLPDMLLQMGFAIFVFAAMMSAYLFTVLRMHKNMMKDEGYLTHTLPVPTWQHIASKLIATYIWVVITIIVIIICGLIFFSGHSVMDEIKETLKYLLEDIKESGINPAILISYLLSPFTWVARVTLCFAIGNLSNKSKLGVSIVTFFALSIAESIISGVTSAVLVLDSFGSNYEAYSFFTLAFTIITSCVYYGVGTHLFTKKLNLE